MLSSGRVALSMGIVMRHPSVMTTGAALSGVAFFFAGLAGAAFADPEPIAPAAEMPALDLFVDSLTAAYAEALVCLKPDAPQLNPVVWSAAKAKLVATLWANGYPADFVHSVAARLEAVKPAAGTDCKRFADAAANANDQGAESDVVNVLSAMGLKVVTEPVAPETWQRIEAAFAAEIPLQKRTFDCVALALPEAMPVLVHDWDQMLAGIGSHLAAAGLDRDAVSKELSGAEANVLWHRAAADEVALRQSCAGDKSWSDRFFQFQVTGLAGEVDKLLPASITNPDP